ncbi:MAG: hypothetical protein H0X25_04660 [Acidobacteriales bacterium]|nr:hypothetical protein [Terriglobales bacterium]
MATRDELIGMIQLTISLLREVNDRLDTLCSALPAQDHKQECSAINREIVAHLSTLRQDFGELAQI